MVSLPADWLMTCQAVHMPHAPVAQAAEVQVGEFAKETGAVCSDGNRFKEHMGSKQHKRAEAQEQQAQADAADQAAPHQVCRLEAVTPQEHITIAIRHVARCLYRTGHKAHQAL